MEAVEETRSGQLFEDAWQGAAGMIDELTKNPEERRFLKSLAMGGTVAAEAAVTNCQGLSGYWGEGNPAQARELSQLFSFLMLSQCYRWLDKGASLESTARTPKELPAIQLIYTFQGEPERGVEDFINFDAQFNYDLDKRPHMIHLASMLLARCCQICGHSCVDWSKVKFPVVEITHLMKGAILDGAPLRSQQDINELVNALGSGVQAMTIFHEKGA